MAHLGASVSGDIDFCYLNPKKGAENVLYGICWIKNEGCVVWKMKDGRLGTWNARSVENEERHNFEEWKMGSCGKSSRK